jgi:hypothetical protein
MTEAKLHPLAAALGEDWRWYENADRRTVAIVHPRGLWTEVDRALLAPGRIEDSIASAIAGSLRRGVLDGVAGLVDVTVAIRPTGVEARIRRASSSAPVSP